MSQSQFWFNPIRVGMLIGFLLADTEKKIEIGTWEAPDQDLLPYGQSDRRWLPRNRYHMHLTMKYKIEKNKNVKIFNFTEKRG